MQTYKAKDKELEKLAKEKIREQIRIDQINRQAEEARRKGEIPTISTQANQPSSSAPKPVPTECVLQV